MKKINIIALIAAIIGLLDAVYLTWIKLSHNETLCAPGLGDCFTVNTSRYSEIFGIPIAILGMATYLAIIGILFFEKRVDFLKENGLLALFGISLVGVLYSIYLSYLEEFVLHAWCPYCILSAIVISIIFVISIVRIKKEGI
ncbi:MAG TPA: vitamin K epoxide reductase family protein [Anaerolineales bacterium]|nr:vitamin K epoxide reductase family protein [Anaerolineales bacterium]